MKQFIRDYAESSVQACGQSVKTGWASPCMRDAHLIIREMGISSYARWASRYARDGHLIESSMGMTKKVR